MTLNGPSLSSCLKKVHETFLFPQCHSSLNIYIWQLFVITNLLQNCAFNMKHKALAFCKISLLSVETLKIFKNFQSVIVTLHFMTNVNNIFLFFYLNRWFFGFNVKITMNVPDRFVHWEKIQSENVNQKTTCNTLCSVK